MLEIKFIRQNIEQVEKVLASRGQNFSLQGFSAIEEERKTLLLEIEQMRHQRNAVSDQIARSKKAGSADDSRVIDMRELGDRLKVLETRLVEVETSLREIVLGLPNLPHASVPAGKDSSDNPVVKRIGEPPRFAFEAQPHWSVGETLGILDFERAARITGARFPLYYGAGARLERALINFMLDIHTQEHGYREVLPPFIVNRGSLIGTGQLPKFEADLFKIEGWDYYLIPTAEVPVTNIHQNEVLDEADLPLRFTAYTPCFRSEAGSYGKDTRGLIRQHQFNKVELVRLAHPERSYDQLEQLLADAEVILQRLELPYQVVTLCTGDMGFASAKTYDIEVWMPSQGVYREISSCSNFEAFQARRANIRFRSKGKKGTDYVHTLNGSGLAVGRTVAALLENFQQPDATVLIPQALRPYLGGMERIAR